jgi:putative sterol carrier protein
MLAFLSPAWLAALDEAARADRDLTGATADLAVVVEQEVTNGPQGTVRYHVVFDHGTVRVASGPAEDPNVRFSQDHATALGIAAGTESAQRAFMTGRLRVGGDLRVLLEHRSALTVLGDVFAAVRAETDLAGEG